MRRAAGALAAAAVLVSGAGVAAITTQHGSRRPLPALANPPPATTSTLPPAPPPALRPARPTTTAAVAPATPSSALAARLDPLLVNTNSCLLVTDGTSGATLYNHQSHVPFAPASTQKLLVAAAALDRLGPGFRFSTTVVAARPPVAGTVDDLWLVGGGDPVLASPEYTAFLQTKPATAGYPTTPLASLAAQLAAAGVRTVRNGIHGDDHRYEVVRYLPSWAPRVNQGELDVGPLGALEVDQGLDAWAPGVLTADPAGHAAGVLARLVGGAAQGADGIAPAGGVVLARITSPPLDQIVAAMLRASDNLIAELLVRELDRNGGGLGTTAGGVRVVMATVAGLGLPTQGLALTDGSGLSATNRVSCETLLAALNLGDRAPFTAMRAGLPVAGVSGTLYNLFRNTPIAGRLAAKGGYITGVGALVGRLDVTRPVRFALVVNGPFGFATGLALEQRVVSALSAG